MKYNYEEEDADEDHTQRLLFSRPRCESHGLQPECNHYSPALHRDFFFVEESGSLTESQHTVSLTGSHSLPATATAAQLITAATTTASVQRHRHRENDTATAAIAEPLVSEDAWTTFAVCCDCLCQSLTRVLGSREHE